MKITDIIYGIWFIEYRVFYRYSIAPTKIVRIECKTLNCHGAVIIYKFTYIRSSIYTQKSKIKKYINLPSEWI